MIDVLKSDRVEMLGDVPVPTLVRVAMWSELPAPCVAVISIIPAAVAWFIAETKTPAIESPVVLPLIPTVYWRSGARQSVLVEDRSKINLDVRPSEPFISK